MPSSSESQLSSFLSSVQPSYRHPDMTKRDVMALLHHYKGLTPKGEKFIFNDGRERELLHLIGTIPVPYKVELTLIVARLCIRKLMCDSFVIFYLTGSDLQYPHITDLAGHPSLSRPHGLRQAHSRHADQGEQARGRQRQDLPALPPRVGPSQLRPLGPCPDVRHHLQRAASGVCEAQEPASGRRPPLPCQWVTGRRLSSSAARLPSATGPWLPSAGPASGLPSLLWSSSRLPARGQ